MPRRTTLLLSIPVLTLISGVSASFCGQNAIPFTFQALRTGQPVLGCARPRCFGWLTANASATPGEPAQFYRIHGKEDGYMRKVDEKAPRGTGQDVSACAMSFGSASCGIGQWVGGIAPQADTRTNMLLRCCSYGPLLQSEDRGIATVKPGQLVVGGEISVDGRIIAFDYVSDIAKTVKADGTVEYNVAVRRMGCLDEATSKATDESLQNVAEGAQQKPRPYNPWENEAVQALPAEAPVQPTPAPQQQQTTQYPGQPVDLLLVDQAPQHPQRAVQQPVAVAPAFQQQTVAQPLPQQPQPQSIQQPQGIQQLAFPPAGGALPQFPMMHQHMNMFGLPQHPHLPVFGLPQMPQQQLPQQQQQQPSTATEVQPVPLGRAQAVQQPQQPQQQFQQPQQFQPQPQPFQQLPALPQMPNNLLFGANQLYPQQQQQQQQVQPQGQQAVPQPQQIAQQQPQPQQQAIPPMTLPRLPKLEELPKMNIPSIEEVENAIPPVEKAILTTVARFFGVL